MFYRKCTTAGYWGYMSIILDLCIFLRRNFKVLSYIMCFWRDMLNKYIVFKPKIVNRLNNQDFNVDQNNRFVTDFFHSRAALLRADR